MMTEMTTRRTFLLGSALAISSLAFAGCRKPVKSEESSGASETAGTESPSPESEAPSFTATGEFTEPVRVAKEIDEKKGTADKLDVSLDKGLGLVAEKDEYDLILAYNPDEGGTSSNPAMSVGFFPWEYAKDKRTFASWAAEGGLEHVSCGEGSNGSALDGYVQVGSDGLQGTVVLWISGTSTVAHVVSYSSPAPIRDAIAGLKIDVVKAAPGAPASNPIDEILGL